MRYATSVGASCARDIGRTIASTARSYRRKKTVDEWSRAKLAPTEEKTVDEWSRAKLAPTKEKTVDEWSRAKLAPTEEKKTVNAKNFTYPGSEQFLDMFV